MYLVSYSTWQRYKLFKVTKKTKTPWPTKAAMAQIYDLKLWGGAAHDFFSGTGSHFPEIVAPYITAVTAFLKQHDTPLSVCDLGCGDFNIGSKLVAYTGNYFAVDIVEALIERNKKRYRWPHVTFKCLDVAKATLPVADCVILRQVLQHISNTEILAVLAKLSSFKYLILTEHVPKGDFTPNLDIISGQGIRLKHQSGVDILKPPFNFKVKTSRLLNSYHLNANKGIINTILYEL